MQRSPLTGLPVRSDSVTPKFSKKERERLKGSIRKFRTAAAGKVTTAQVTCTCAPRQKVVSAHPDTFASSSPPRLSQIVVFSATALCEGSRRRSRRRRRRRRGRGTRKILMARWRWVVCFLVVVWVVSSSAASAQYLSPSQTKTLFRLQRILERPAPLDGWNNRTNPCALPPSPSIAVACSGNRVTKLSVSGAGGRLSPDFSIDALFTTLARLPNLTELSLVSLGLWGPLPAKVDRLHNLCVLNLSSNYISGAIPQEISTMGSLWSLVLDGNELNGTVPDLGSLQEVNLAGNRLGPALPALGDGAVSVVLRNNSFRSGIPPAIQRLVELQRLDLSANQLQGPVPAFLFSLPAIRHLDLSQNHFSGSLPAGLSCATSLGFVDVSRNLLLGSLPECIAFNTSGRVVLDSGNCLSSGDPTYQRPTSYCNEAAFAAVIPSKPVVKNGGTPGKKKNTLGLVLGVVGGVVGGAALLGLVLVVVMKRARMVEAEVGGGLLKPAPAKVMSVQASPRLPADTRHMAQAVRMGTLGLLPYRVFSMEELEEATDSFDSENLIGKDPGSQTYKGWLRDGSTVMVRCLRLKQRYSPQSVAQFIDAISKLRHHHLVCILGHCIDAGQENTHSSNCVYLVFEHVSSGTLRSYLTEWSKSEMLKWPQRVSAVIGVARGIQFLHSVTVPGISGNVLNVENILLDEALTAKISNYNLPMVSVNKNNKGASESPFVAATVETDRVRNRIHSEEHGEKEDVYQLGGVLLEIITGKPVATRHEVEALRIQLEESLREEDGKLRDLADPNIRGTFAYDSLRTAVEIALNCVSNDLGLRPSIDDILWNLQYSVQVQNGWASHDSFHVVP
ncbi:hypothetical protein Taro_007962 [Colocasia esculenta]|uniref:Protein kinase domain-containing protein n=1 Tax=Colocasia esculenta TaxID=4460 RepID=A0A843TVN6_COLES|nr:hypothetical protein [Colocasia esculenta]